MSFVISSGTSIFEIVERRDSAAAALVLISELLAKRRPNVTVADRTGLPVRFAHLRRLADAEHGRRRGTNAAPSN